MDGRKIFAGGTLAISAASLAVGSVALATQPKIPEVSESSINIVVPNEGEREIAKPEIIKKLVVEVLEQNKEGRDIREIKEVADEAFNEANRATFEVREITEQMNTNIDIYNNGFKTLVKDLEQNLKNLGDLNKQFKDWKEGTEEAFKELKKEYEEIKKLGEELRTIKEVSDIGTIREWVNKRIEPYMQEKIDLKNAFDRVVEKFEGLKQDVELLTEELDDLRVETTGN